jgi:DNA-binding NtrC family response regulator
LGERKKILLAENERIIALDIKKVLEENGYTVLDILFNTSVILSYLNQQKPDLLITGVKGIPNYTALIKKIIYEYKIPILIVSGVPESELSELKEMKSCSFLRKPIDHEQLRKTVEHALTDNSH